MAFALVRYPEFIRTDAGGGSISVALRADVDDWLHHYNYERPHLGYRNMGNRPFETINEYRQVLGKKPKCTLDG